LSSKSETNLNSIVEIINGFGDICFGRFIFQFIFSDEIILLIVIRCNVSDKLHFLDIT